MGGHIAMRKRCRAFYGEEEKKKEIDMSEVVDTFHANI